MKIKDFGILSIIISAILFIIPFFWLKPGEMNLGGDSSRLYFYDPYSYLHVQTLYGVVTSGIGGDGISYYAIPYILLLSVLRIFFSPTLVISLFNGITLSIAFLSCYLIIKVIIKELAASKGVSYKKENVEFAAILAGFFYLFSPASIFSGWDRAILPHIQIFLNPLIFLLILKYFITLNLRYLLILLITTFIFSFNFSFVGAPSFFAFYPLSLLFLFICIKYIRKSAFPVKGLIVGGSVFILLQSFHLGPHIFSLFSSESDINTAVFSDKTKFIRGLDYFSAIAPNIKVSLSLLNLPQVREIGLFMIGFVVFPAVVIMGLLLNGRGMLFHQKRTLLLTGIFFLIIVFFVSANITNIGLAFYKLLFYIPGFQMFRNFYGQWAFVYIFFYSLLIGQSIAILLDRMKKYYAYILIVYIGCILLVSSWPLINGSMINAIHFQSKGIKQTIKMDPTYEKVLAFVRSSPVDGKILTLPLPGPGYQIIAGKNGGAYIGPSTFSYLAGKSDFSGYDGLGPYGDFFVQSVRDRDFPNLQKLFSLLNIKYIFYNSDPYIYYDNFPYYLYDYVINFLPKDPKSYKDFVSLLPIDENKKIDFGDKYHFYPLKDSVFTPHIYTTTKVLYTNDPVSFPFVFDINNLRSSAVFYFKDSNGKKDSFVSESQTSDPLFLIKDNSHLHRYEPFISRELDEIAYPFAVLKEKFELWKTRKNHKRYIDLSLFYLSKRVFELARWSDKMPITGHQYDTWKEPTIWEFYRWKEYNSWESSIYRYKLGMLQFIDWLLSVNMPKSWLEANKIKVNEQLFQHQLKLVNVIKSSNINNKERRYLLSLVEETVADLFEALKLSHYDPFSRQYDLIVPKDKEGLYEVYLEKKDNFANQVDKTLIEVNGKNLKPKKRVVNDLIQFDTVEIGSIKGEKTLPVTLHLSLNNLLEHQAWQSSGDTNSSRSATILKINNAAGDKSGGLIQQVLKWEANKQYLLSFDYQTFGDDFILKVYDIRPKDFSAKDITRNVYFEKNLNSKTWKTQQSVLTSDPKSIEGLIQILANSEKIKSEIHIKNLSVIEIINPKIFFKKVIPQEKGDLNPPAILFTKINPTKYKIEVKGAVNPYTLVFLEQFSRNWKLEDITKKTNRLQSRISGLFGRINSILVSLFIKDRSTENKVVASYFNGRVKEGVHKEIFLSPSTFETWGRDPVADDKHFRVNGYANGWNIDPKDMDGRTNYTLILEMVTQKRLYPFLFISLLTFFTVLIYLIFRIFSINEKGN